MQLVNADDKSPPLSIDDAIRVCMQQALCTV
jgi:hypothetical protein